MPERVRTSPFVRDSLLPLKEFGLLELVEGDVEVNEHIRLIPAPGHTPGHCVAAVESDGQTALQLGDLVHHCKQFELPDMVRDGDSVKELVADSRRKVAQLAWERSALLASGHDKFPGLGRIVLEGDRYVFRVEV